MRNDYRDFRLDRISDVCLTEKPFLKQHPTLQQYMDSQKCERDVQEVILNVSKRAHGYLDGQKYYNGFISETVKDDCVEMVFLTNSIEGFARWYMMFGDEADIVKSEPLKEKVKTLLEEIAQRL